MKKFASEGFVDYYRLLHIQTSAELTEIRKAYLLQAKVCHPDAGGDEAAMRQLNEAYKTLTDRERKLSYDHKHQRHTGNTDNIYRYTSDDLDLDAMDDADIDKYLDDLLVEYRTGLPKQKRTLKQLFKQMLNI